jgi:GNAT superfamily N-acetyltransferase
LSTLGYRMDEIKLIAFNLHDHHDVDEILALCEKYFSNAPWPVTRDKVQKGAVVYFRAYLNHNYVGITGFNQKTPTLAETTKTVIFDEFRGQGLGKKVSLAIEEQCRIRGIKKVMSTVYYFNHAMLNIKLKQGYTIEGYHPDHEAPGFHEYSLGKILT